MKATSLEQLKSKYSNPKDSDGGRGLMADDGIIKEVIGGYHSYCWLFFGCFVTINQGNDRNWLPCLENTGYSGPDWT